MKQFINQHRLRVIYCSLSEQYEQFKNGSAKFNVDDPFLDELNEFIQNCNEIMMNKKYRNGYQCEAQYMAKCASHMRRRLVPDEDE